MVYRVILTVILLLAFRGAWGHNINIQMENAPNSNVILYYGKLGIEHIIPLGIDHILFIVALCLLNNKIKAILWQATAFTVAHSITLTLSIKNIIRLPSEIVEPIIAISILFIAIENLIIRELKAWRILLVFLFGLIHGLGFAAVLDEIGLPRNKFFTSLISFNLGVEIGQIVIILMMFFLLLYPFGNKPWFKKIIVYPLSILIAVIATYWTYERIFQA